MRNDLLLGDCLEKMSYITSGSVDLVLTDPPYGTTGCKWDVILPFDLMWGHLNRIIKPNGAILLFGTEPFSSGLRTSNIKHFKYDWYWEKDKPTGHLNAKKMPMRKLEIISVFYYNQCAYYPQLIDKDPRNIRPNIEDRRDRKSPEIYGKMDNLSIREIPIDKGYPTEILKFRSCGGGGTHADGSEKVHPTQKPVDLLEYLIKTYTIEGDTVLDFTMGSGSTGVACVNTKRNFIGIEKDEKYFEIAKQRIHDAPGLEVFYE